MPMAAPILIAGVMGAIGPALAGAGLTAIIGGFVISAALSGLSMLLTQKGQSGGGAPTMSSFASTDPGSKVTGNQADTPRQIVYGRTRVNGTVIFQATTSNKSVLLLVIALADHESESVDEIWFGSEKVWTAAGGVVSGKFSGKVGVAAYLGTDDQEADPYLVSTVPDRWTSAHRLRGVTYIRLNLTWNREAFGGFSPQSVWTVMKGKKVYDPRDESTVYSNNAALCVADYIASERHGLGAAYGTEIDTVALAAAASVCDEECDIGDDETEARYTLNGSIRLDQKPIDVLGGMLSAMAGRCAWSGGKWRIGAAAWSVPVLEFDEDDLRGGFTVQNLLGRRNSFNSAKGTYVNPDKQWQSDSFPPVEVDDYIDADDGEQAWKESQLPFTDSPTTAQRIVTIDLRRGRQPLSMTLPLKLSGLRAAVGDNVLISNERLGWSSKAFEVVGLKLAFETSNGASVVIGVDLDLRETDATVFADGDIDTFVDPAPNTGLPDYFEVLPASNVRLTESLYPTRSGTGVKNKGLIAWDASPDRFVQSGGHYIPQYRLVDATRWLTLPSVPGEDDELAAEIPDMPAGTYEARVIAVSYLGGRSTAATTPHVPISGLAAPPAAPQNFTVNAMESFALARCSRAADLDVLEGGYIVFRHSALTTGATWDTATSLCDPLPAAAGAWALPLKAGTYLAKFYDSSGIPSTTAASFPQRQASAHNFAGLVGGTSQQDPDFSGTHDGTAVIGAALYLAGSGLISEIPLMSAVPSIAFYGGVLPEGHYDFDAVMDLGSVKRHRLTNALSAQVLNAFDRIGTREGLVSSWPSIAGEVTGDEADTYLLVASTDDNPAGAPTWTDWQRLDSATFNTRAHKFRRVLKSNDTSFTIAISGDTVAAEGV